MTLHLVRHGRPLVDPDVPPDRWPLDPAGYDAVWALRESGRLPVWAAWFTSPEPKAVETAQLLTDGQVGVIDQLAEQRQEPLEATRERIVPVVQRILDVHGDQDVVLVGHSTAWTILAAELTGEAPDLDRWARLAMPDVIRISGGAVIDAS